MLVRLLSIFAIFNNQALVLTLPLGKNRIRL